jgi:Icc-related predicted phosphoesterase
VWEKDHIRFAGTTLWYPDHPLNPIHAGKMNDQVWIHGFNDWVYKENKKAVSFLRSEAATVDVVITHYLPSYQVVAPKYRGSELNRFFVCDLTELIEESRPPLWLYGHTHTPGFHQIGETKLITNPYGYPQEPHKDWNPKLVLNVQPR